ncbi:hypothetical protein [uncultured Microbulbifer sp.]|uniref:hypothetical protein n=1 Tax=uncultured Microbulbifer sp. TaxID=348147 RepID=UPI0025F7E08E|nr:hypothetical protein [uncultured Microbulbifer sp.]
MFSLHLRTLASALALTGSTLLLGACAGQPGQPDSRDLRQAVPDYPPVSLFYKHPSDSLDSECRAFDGQSLLHHCNSNRFDLHALQQNLEQSGKFQQVSLADNAAQYQVLTSIAVLDQETGDELGNAALSGATLMMLPMVTKKTLRAEVVVTWQQLPIKQYNYTIPFEFSASLFNGANSYDKKLTANIGEHLLADLQQENIFSGSYLMAALDASDYEHDLVVPDAVEDYFLDEKYILNNPFHGALLTFQHKQFAFDRAEVFVYPIRNTDWQDAGALSASEAENLRAELNLMLRQGEIQSLDLGAVEPRHWRMDGRNYRGIFYTGTLTDLEGQSGRTATYIFTKEDKFVRVRAVFPTLEDNSIEAQNPDAFVKALLKNIQPPGESLFMAKLRQKRRQSTIASPQE